MTEYKDGKGDYYLAEGLRDELRAAVERIADPIGGLDLMARLLDQWSGKDSNPNVSAWLRTAASDLRAALAAYKGKA